MFLFTCNGNCAYVHIKTHWSSLNPYQWLLFVKGMETFNIFNHLLLQYQSYLASAHARLLLFQSINDGAVARLGLLAPFLRWGSQFLLGLQRALHVRLRMVLR